MPKNAFFSTSQINSYVSKGARKQAGEYPSSLGMLVRFSSLGILYSSLFIREGSSAFPVKMINCQRTTSAEPVIRPQKFLFSSVNGSIIWMPGIQEYEIGIIKLKE